MFKNNFRKRFFFKFKKRIKNFFIIKKKILKSELKRK